MLVWMASHFLASRRSANNEKRTGSIEIAEDRGASCLRMTGSQVVIPR